MSKPYREKASVRFIRVIREVIDRLIPERVPAPDNMCSLCGARGVTPPECWKCGGVFGTRRG